MKLKTTKTLIKGPRKKLEIKRRTKYKNIIYEKLELRIKLKINKTFTKIKKIRHQKIRIELKNIKYDKLELKDKIEKKGKQNFYKKAKKN